MKPEHEIPNKALRQLALLGEDLKKKMVSYGEAIEAVKERHEAGMNKLQAQINTIEKGLKAYMKKHSAGIFEGDDRVELENGSLLFKVEYRVKQARGVLKKLEELGIDEAVEVSKKVKWNELEKWPVEKLVMVGTEKKRKEIFDYELK
jgi:phage host-nuclease inhibitor protein Gam